MKIALYIAFQNKSSIDCCKEIIDLISENNQLIIDSKVKNDLDESKIGFTVTRVSHKIENNDWTTSLTGTCRLLP